MPGPLSRRSFLAGAAGTGLAVTVGACGGGGEAEVADTGPQLLLRPGFAAGDRFPPATVAGIPQRLPFVVSDLSSGQVGSLDDPPAEIGFEIFDANGASVAASTAPLRSVGILTPYHPIEVTLPAPGRYEARATILDTPLSAGFQVVDRREVGLVQVGDAIRPVETPTFDDARGVDPICTRAPEPCPFHEVTLTEAIAREGPTAVLIATPGFCLTDICGPVVDLLIEAAADFTDVTFVHAEVYTDPQMLFEDGVETEDILTRAMMIYELGFEPSIVVADTTGTVTSRLDFTFDDTDLRAALAAAP